MQRLKIITLLYLLSTSAVFAEDYLPFDLEAIINPELHAEKQAERIRLEAEQVKMDMAKSCEQLYVEIRQLYGQSYASNSTFWENPVNHAIMLTGTMFNPAYYGLVYTGAMDVKHKMDANTRRERLNTLRQYSASKRCFSG